MIDPRRSRAVGAAKASGPLAFAVDARGGDRFHLVSAVAGS